MKVRYTAEALRDLDEILTFTAQNYPTITASFEERLRAIERRIREWPESAREVTQCAGVRVVPFIRYPYKLFYQVTDDAVEILHIHHAARREPWENDD
jgi:toxin ParE1/3/4